MCSFNALFDLIKHGIISIVIKVESEKTDGENKIKLYVHLPMENDQEINSCININIPSCSVLSF